jgi:hypothetical protein
METSPSTHACLNPKLQPIHTKLANSYRRKEWNSIMVFDMDEEVVGDAKVVGDVDAVVNVNRLHQILDLQHRDPTCRLHPRLVHLLMRALPDLLRLLVQVHRNPKKGTRRRRQSER